MSAKRIIDVARSAGDATLGQTLLRLASLASAAHRFDAAASLLAAPRPGHVEHSREVCGRAAGVDAPADMGPVCTDAAGSRRQSPRQSSVCTEANR